ncbi:hypothetical protein M422DRAFT_260543, partial [Sphaerobolus stellatus SS14]
MASTRTRAVSSSTKLKTQEASFNFDDLSDPNKYNEELVQRLAIALNLSDYLIPSKPVLKEKSKATLQAKDSSSRRKLAMTAANGASNNLTKLMKSSWRARDQASMNGISTEKVYFIALSFRLAIHALRDTPLQSIDVERSASSFIGKLVALQIYDLALEMLADQKPFILHHYYEISEEPTLRKISAKRPILRDLSFYLHLIRYPFSSPTEEPLLGIISASIAYALVSLAALISIRPEEPECTDQLLSALEAEDSVHGWRLYLSTEQADSLLFRSHRCIATSFSPSNTSARSLFRLRSWAIGCLVKRSKPATELIWSDATQCVASYHKAATHGQHVPNDAVHFFDSLIKAIEPHPEAKEMLASPLFHEFCETVLVLAEKGDNTDYVQHISRFIKVDVKQSETSPEIGQDNNMRLQLLTVFSHAAKLLEKESEPSEGDKVQDVISQAMKGLGRLANAFDDPISDTRLMRSLERLRRLCITTLESEKPCSTPLRGPLIEFLDHLTVVMLKSLTTENITMEFIACMVSTLCTLSRAQFSSVNYEAQTIAFELLQRGSVLLPSQESSHSLSDTEFLILIKALNVLATNFWAHGRTLYERDNHSMAIRFLMPACELTARLCAADRDETLPSEFKEALATSRERLTRRWQVLADAYIRIGDRKLAYNAFVQTVKTFPSETICGLASSLHPTKILAEPPRNQLSYSIRQLTRLSTFELRMGTNSSLYHLLVRSGAPLEFIGLVIEQQLATLEESWLKTPTQAVVASLFQDALNIYDSQNFPVRRVRVLLQQLEFYFHIDVPNFNASTTVENVLSLLSSNTSGKDHALSHFRRQYEAMAHLWMALHSYRQADSTESGMKPVSSQAAIACKLLNELFPTPTVTSLAQLSPKQTPPLPRVRTLRSSPRKRTTKAPPVTPKPRRKVVDTPPRMAQIKMSAHSKPTPPQSAPVELDPALGKLIGVVSQLLGLLGDIPLRIQFLNLMQKTAQFASQPSTDEFIYATIAAAAEYLELGKVRRALTIYETALPALEKVSEDVKVNFMLNHSEALAIRGKLVKSVQLYEEARELADSIVYPPGQSMIGRIQAKIRSLEMSACAAKTFSVIQTARNDTHRSLASLKRCLRLWNKAYDALTHLLPNQSGESNPLDMASLAAALPALDSEEMRKTQNPPTPDGLHLRIADGLVNCLFDIAEVYLHLGSGRDSEYFLQRARELAQSLSSPVLVIRALAKLTELQLYRGHVQEVVANFELAENYLKD